MRGRRETPRHRSASALRSGWAPSLSQAHRAPAQRISHLPGASVSVLASPRYRLGERAARLARTKEKAPVSQIRTTLVAAATLAVAVTGFIPAAQAQGNQKSVQNEAQFVKYDEATSSVVVKILKKGKGNAGLMKEFDDKVKNGKEATFNVIPTGSVLTRTSVAVN